MDFQGNLIVDSLKGTSSNTGEFITRFPADLTYSNDDFQIGLKEAHLPFDWLKFQKYNYCVLYSNLTPDEERVVRVPPMLKENVMQFINDQLEKWTDSHVLFLGRDDKSGRSYIMIDEQTYTILFTEELANFLGFKIKTKHDGQNWTQWDNNERTTYYKEYIRTQPVYHSTYDKEVQKGKRYLFSEKRQEKIAKRLFIHADCVKHHLLGNSWSQVLEIVPNQPIDRYRFDKPCFYPLYCNRFNSITVKLTDDTGANIPIRGRILLILEIKRAKL